MSALQQELQRKNIEIQLKNGEILQLQGKNIEIQRKDAHLQRKDNEIQRKYSEIDQLTTALHDKDVMMETLRSDLSKLQITTSHSLPNKVSK